MRNNSEISLPGHDVKTNSPEPVLSIVIVSWNTRQLLIDCLQSVWAEMERAFAPGQVETFVVDNVSTDGSAETVRQDFSWVKLIENQTNTGFARANNQAIELCTGRYVLLLNPDTKVLPGGLSELMRFMDNHAEAGAVGSRLLNPDGTLQVSCHPRPMLSRELWRLFHLDKVRAYALYRMEQWSTTTAREVDVVQGAAMLLRREVLEQVGVLDPDYFIYSEEVDLCYRVQRGGWRIYWVPTSEVIHYGGQSTRQVAAAMFLRLYQGKILYFRKNHGKLAAELYKLIVLAASAIRVLLSPLALLSSAAQRKRNLTLASNYRRLLLALPKM
jgi:GT2 family glycosyltransferase